MSIAAKTRGDQNHASTLPDRALQRYRAIYIDDMHVRLLNTLFGIKFWELKEWLRS